MNVVRSANEKCNSSLDILSRMSIKMLRSSQRDLNLESGRPTGCIRSHWWTQIWIEEGMNEHCASVGSSEPSI